MLTCVSSVSAQQQQKIAAADAILAHIRMGDLKDGFTRRDCYRQEWSDLTCGVAVVQSALDLLCDLKRIERYRVRPRTGRPTFRYVIRDVKRL